MISGNNPIEVKLGGTTPIRDIVDELTYRSYRYNRMRSPDIKPSDWAWVFVDAEQFEERYQKEINSRMPLACDTCGKASQCTTIVHNLITCELYEAATP